MLRLQVQTELRNHWKLSLVAVLIWAVGYIPVIHPRFSPLLWRVGVLALPLEG